MWNLDILLSACVQCVSLSSAPGLSISITSNLCSMNGPFTLLPSVLLVWFDVFEMTFPARKKSYLSFKVWFQRHLLCDFFPSSSEQNKLVLLCTPELFVPVPRTRQLCVSFIPGTPEWWGLHPSREFPSCVQKSSQSEQRGRHINTQLHCTLKSYLKQQSELLHKNEH